MNYVASTAYGVVALLLLFVYAYSVDSDSAMRAIVLAAAFAWASCYFGAAYDMSDGNDMFLRIVSIILTLVAVAWYVVALWVVILSRIG